MTRVFPARLVKSPAQTLRQVKADARLSGFMAWLDQHGLPRPIAEYRFAPPRKWRFDYCWVDKGIALEEQGGLFVGGRHVRGAALLQEHEKLNAAALAGLRVLFASPQTIRSREMLATLTSLLK